MGSELKDILQKLIGDGKVVFACMDEDEDKYEIDTEVMDDSQLYEAAWNKIVTKGERVTQQRIMNDNETRSHEIIVKYQAAGFTKQMASLDQAANILAAKGILWDTLDALHDPFVSNVEVNWEASTRFMVAVGLCKDSLLKGDLRPNPYGTGEAKVEAFWLTLLAGQTTYFDDWGTKSDVKERMRCHERLPPIRATWTRGTPPITVVTAGRLEVAELNDAFEQILPALHKEQGGDAAGFSRDKNRVTMPGVKMLRNLQPEEWTSKHCTSSWGCFADWLALVNTTIRFIPSTISPPDGDPGSLLEYQTSGR